MKAIKLFSVLEGFKDKKLQGKKGIFICFRGAGYGQRDAVKNIWPKERRRAN
jgi:hypothetical protein